MPRLRYPKCLRPAVPLIRSKIVQEDEAPRVSIYENNYKHQAVYIRLRFWKYYTLLLNWNLNDLRILIRWYKRKAAWTLILIQKQACVRWKINHHTRWKWTCESKRVLTSNTSPKQQPWGGGTRADFVGPKWNIDKRTKCKWYSVTPSSLVLNWGEESEQWRTCEKTCLERRQHLIGHGIVRVDGWRQTRKKVQHFLRLRRHLESDLFPLRGLQVMRRYRFRHFPCKFALDTSVMLETSQKNRKRNEDWPGSETKGWNVGFEPSWSRGPDMQLAIYTHYIHVDRRTAGACRSTQFEWSDINHRRDLIFFSAGIWRLLKGAVCKDGACKRLHQWFSNGRVDGESVVSHSEPFSTWDLGKVESFIAHAL